MFKGSRDVCNSVVVPKGYLSLAEILGCIKASPSQVNMLEEQPATMIFLPEFHLWHSSNYPRSL